MTSASSLYLDLLARALVGDLRRDPDDARTPRAGATDGVNFSASHPPPGDTMVGLARLDSLRDCVEVVLREGVPGDLIEAGVWRGGSAIYMRGLLEAFGDAHRHVVVADSFEGLPAPSHPADAEMRLHEIGYLSVSLSEVRANFRRYELLDHRVEFVEGWFKDSLPALRGRAWSLIRLDGDLYESTMDSLTNLYDGLSVGGFVIVDDYGAYEACRAACEDFRRQRSVVDDVVEIDWTGVYWRKTR
jgi:O-methyltransferase